jgi:hypothetical protein
MSNDPHDPAAAALAEYVQVYADSSHMWARYHDQRDAYREAAERVAAAAAALKLGALSGFLYAQSRPPRSGDRRTQWTDETTERLLAKWRSGKLGD